MPDGVDQSAEPYLRLAEFRKRGQETGIISEWVGEASEARAKMRVRVAYLTKIPRVQWDKEHFRSLGKGLWELKWKAEGKQFRALGYDYKGYFVMVLGCTHKQRVYAPPDCLKIARKRMGEFQNGDWEIVEFEA
jgi:hypothetical protein